MQLLCTSVLCAGSVLQWLLQWLWLCVVLVQLVLVLIACALRTGGSRGAEGNTVAFAVGWCSLEFNFTGVEFC